MDEFSSPPPKKEGSGVRAKSVATRKADHSLSSGLRAVETPVDFTKLDRFYGPSQHEKDISCAAPLSKYNDKATHACGPRCKLVFGDKCPMKDLPATVCPRYLAYGYCSQGLMHAEKTKRGEACPPCDYSGHFVVVKDTQGQYLLIWPAQAGDKGNGGNMTYKNTLGHYSMPQSNASKSGPMLYSGVVKKRIAFATKTEEREQAKEDKKMETQFSILHKAAKQHMLKSHDEGIKALVTEIKKSTPATTAPATKSRKRSREEEELSAFSSATPDQIMRASASTLKVLGFTKGKFKQQTLEYMKRQEEASDED